MSAFKKEIRDDVSGYVLHARPYQERSLLLTLLTLECGRVSAVMRLSAKSAARSRAELRPFCPLFFSLVQGRSDLLVLRSARPSGAGLKFPVPAVFCAEYLNELLYCLYKDREPPTSGRSARSPQGRTPSGRLGSLSWRCSHP